MAPTCLLTVLKQQISPICSLPLLLSKQLLLKSCFFFLYFHCKQAVHPQLLKLDSHFTWSNSAAVLLELPLPSQQYLDSTWNTPFLNCNFQRSPSYVRCFTFYSLPFPFPLKLILWTEGLQFYDTKLKCNKFKTVLSHSVASTIKCLSFLGKYL